jgi:hypothetical protein
VSLTAAVLGMVLILLTAAFELFYGIPVLFDWPNRTADERRNAVLLTTALIVEAVFVVPQVPPLLEALRLR